MRLKHFLILFYASFFISCVAQDVDKNNKAVLDRVTSSDGLSNAFTDLVYFDSHFFLVYRESDKHVFGRDGVIKLLKSKDGKKWRLVKDFAMVGIDLRDPKLVINQDELMLYIHGSTFEGKNLVKFTDYRYNYSNNWEKSEIVTLDNQLKTVSKISGNQAWPWRVTWINGKAYTVGYNGVDVFRFYESDDGLSFKSLPKAYSNVALPTEATIKVNDKGDVYVLTRRNYASALFQKYNKENFELNLIGELPFINFGGPNFLFLDDKHVLFGGSFGNVLVGVYNLETNQSKILYRFGGGDCGYPGMLIKDNILYFSFYSSHETKNGSSIYIAKIKLEDLSL